MSTTFQQLNSPGWKALSVFEMHQWLVSPCTVAKINTELLCGPTVIRDYRDMFKTWKTGLRQPSKDSRFFPIKDCTNPWDMRDSMKCVFDSH